jgi:hypothetical protein
MKEQEIIKAINKVDNMSGKVHALIGQMNSLKDMAIGTLETLKRMPEYDSALEKLKEDMSKNVNKKEVK